MISFDSKILFIFLSLSVCYVFSNNSSNQWSGNPFNERSFIVYRPQTHVLENRGQEKPGLCPITRSAPGFKTFKQYEGLWFKRWRSRLRTDEPFFKCSFIHYISEANNGVFILDNLQNNVTNEWRRQNATAMIYDSTPASWSSTLQSGASFDTHLLYFDEELGIALLYSCSNTMNGHNGIANIYTRSPDTPLTKTMLGYLHDIYFQNGIYDVLPMHEIRHDNCSTPTTTGSQNRGNGFLKRVNDLGHKNIYNN